MMDNSSNDKETPFYYGAEKYENFAKAAKILADTLDSLPGAKEAVRDYSLKLLQLIAETTAPGIDGNRRYCQKKIASEIKNNMNTGEQHE